MKPPLNAFVSATTGAVVADGVVDCAFTLETIEQVE